jgi:hypothetical protein
VKILAIKKHRVKFVFQAASFRTRAELAADANLGFAVLR